jgi:L-ascorbate metabolism protein UlaG (beta-lactamase superfamily)
MTSNAVVKITWLGHATTLLRYSGKTILIDPWLRGNPAVPEHARRIEILDLMLITHGHSDHMADAVEIALRTGADVICINEVANFLQGKGVTKTTGLGTGGAVDWNGTRITLTHAIHSCAISDGDRTVDGGAAGGLVLEFGNGFSVYHAGDTDVFEEMKYIGARYHPNVALLPIGGHYTMDPMGAAQAIRLLGVKSVIPIHYATFPILKGTPDQLREAAEDVEDLRVVALKPGESVSQDELG